MPKRFTAAAVSTYSPLDSIAGMLSLVPLPAPTMEPPPAAFTTPPLLNSPKPKPLVAEIAESATLAADAAADNAVSAAVTAVVAAPSAGLVVPVTML